MVRVLGVAALALAAACGSSGGGNDGGGGSGGTTGSGSCETTGTATGPGSTPGSKMTWSVDGVADCADFVSGTHSTKNGFDQLAVIGGNTRNHAVNLHIDVPTGAIEVGKAYPCDPAYVQLIYSAGPPMGLASTYTSASCSITVTSLGSATTAATGMFSGMFTSDAGVSMLTDGTFTVVPKIQN